MASGQRSAVSGKIRCPLSSVLCTLFSALCLLPSLSFAAFETMDTGARQSGLGEAYAAIGGDIHTLLHNPAGLAYLNRNEFSSSYSRLFMGLDDKSNLSSFQLLYGRPVNNRGSLGLGWMETKLNGLYKERTLSLGYGYIWKDNLAIGATLKQLQIMEAAPEINYGNSGFVAGRADPVFANGNTAAGIGMDLGILYEPFNGYSMGLSLQNINQPKVSLRDCDRIPALIRFGIARRSSPLLLASEIRTREFIRGVRDYQAVFGAERWWRPKKNSSFALRGSLAAGSRSFSQFTLGLGYRVNDVQVDYSFLIPLSGVSFGSTGGTHRISLSMRFGNTVPKNISWVVGNAPYGVELEKMRQRADQAERLTQALQEQIKKLWDELETQRQILVSISTGAAGIEPPASLIIEDLGRQIQDLKRQIEKAGQQKPAQTPQAGQEPAAARIIQDLGRQIQDLKQQIEKARQQKPAETFQAKPEFSKIVTDSEKAQEFFREGMRHYGLRELQKAVQAFQKSLEFDPTNEWAKKSLERTLTELKQEKAQQKPAPKAQPIRYVTRKEDTLQSLAKAFYWDPDKWTVIRDANPKIKDPHVIPEGIVVIIPQIPEFTVPIPENKP
ncbi:MAG: conjugal transfer protein TraF [Elusimicrobia bacterium]|nr:conjugal transfer protein TraF [Elusimicrobiota bacterium]